MATTKTRLASGKISWGYLFSIGPKSSRQQYKKSGFKTEKAALLAEAAERLRVAAIPVPVANPHSLAQVIARFIEEGRADRSPKTTSRYLDMAEYLSPALRGRDLRTITTLDLHEEWKRLKASGGHHRKTREARPLSPGTVRLIASIVSAAYKWAILYGLTETNPVTHSKPPRGRRREPIALSPEQQDTLIAGARGPWCLGAFLEVEAGLGARRGEVLALRWADIQDGYAHIRRSLGQVGKQLYYKSTKGNRSRVVEIPERTLEVLQAHRATQDEHRRQFGSDYRTDLDLVFCDVDGRELRPNTISATVSRMCRKVGLPPGASLHTLRHSHGSQLLAMGVPITEVSERLGHANPGITLGVYSHAIPGRGTAAKAWQEMQTKREGPATGSTAAAGD